MSRSVVRRLQEQVPEVKEALDLLVDAWVQFSIEDSNETRWAGGLSTLEDIHEFLVRQGRIGKNGKVLS